jgi:lipid-A-disaccharide synthase
MNRIFIIAGDLSGDFHGSRLAQEIKNISPQTEIYSAAGKYLASESHQILDLTQIAVTGIIEVLEYLPKIFRHLKKIRNKAEELKPDLIILIDFPDFNLRLAEKLKSKDFNIFYYISPQIWAWRKKRINSIRKNIDKMLVIFPFEKEFYSSQNVNSIYVGHPLIENMNIHLKEKKESPVTKVKKIAFLPGSRKNEVKKHLPVMIKTKRRLQGKGLEFIIIKHPHLDRKMFSQAEKEGIVICENDKYNCLAKTDIAVSSSGTATLELALMNIPTIVIYKTSFISWLILKALVKTEFISIVNILTKEKVFPELLQDKATPENISSICSNFITNPDFFKKTKQKLKTLKDILGKESAPKKAAQEVVNWLKNK